MTCKMLKDRRGLAAALLLGATGLSPALAQEAPPQATPASTSTAPAAEPSTNAMVNLIRLLVQQGTITQTNGDALLKQALGEAAQARTASGELPAAAPGTIRVPYIPETVRNQIRDDIKKEVMQQAAFEGWAAPDQQAPAWVKNITISGDIRFRSQSELFSKDNIDPNGSDGVIDYARINATSGGFDFTKNSNNLPIVNTTEDRLNRLRLRARLGVTANIGKYVTTGFKLATGDDTSPISTNQILGGGLAKRNIWLDQAYLKVTPTDWISASYGRFTNPFRSTDLLFDNDLNFDGVAVELNARPWLKKGLKLALRGGAFPLDFGSGDFPSTSTTKKKYPSKWLLSGQIEGGYDFENGIEIRLAAAYHRFSNVQGQLSEPCAFNGQVIKFADGSNDPEECSTDGTRAFFPRKGNTLFFLRQITVPATDPTGQAASNRQFLGLSYRYSILDLNTSIRFPIAGVNVWAEGNYLRNLAFKRSDSCRYGSSIGFPITNVETVKDSSNNDNANPCTTDNPARLRTGNEGYLARLTVGYAKPKKWGEWNISGSYRYLQSDAVLDSLTDSDFHLGGTNAKGYTIAGSLGLFDGVTLSGRWLSANEITGRPLAIDVFQLDLSAEF